MLPQHEPSLFEGSSALQTSRLTQDAGQPSSAVSEAEAGPESTSIRRLYEDLKRAPMSEVQALLSQLDQADSKNLALLVNLKTKQRGCAELSKVIENSIHVRFAAWSLKVSSVPPPPAAFPDFLKQAMSRLYVSPGAVALLHDLCIERVEIPHFWLLLFGALVRDLYPVNAPMSRSLNHHVDEEYTCYLLCSTIRLVASREIARAAQRDSSLARLSLWRDGIVATMFGILAKHFAASAKAQLQAEVSKIAKATTTSLDVNPLAVSIELETAHKQESIYFNGQIVREDIALARRTYNTAAKVKRLVDSRASKLAEITSGLFSALLHLLTSTRVVGLHSTLRALHQELNRNFDGQDCDLALARIVAFSLLIPALQVFASGQDAPANFVHVVEVLKQSLLQSEPPAVTPAINGATAASVNGINKIFAETWEAPLATARDDIRGLAAKMADALSEPTPNSIVVPLVYAHSRHGRQVIFPTRRTLAFIEFMLPLIARRTNNSAWAPLLGSPGTSGANVTSEEEDRFLETAHKLDDDWGYSLEMDVATLCPLDDSVKRLSDLARFDIASSALVPSFCASTDSLPVSLPQLPNLPRGRLAVVSCLDLIPPTDFVDDLPLMVQRFGDDHARSALENHALGLLIERMQVDATERVEALKMARRDLQRQQAVRDSIAAALKAVDGHKIALEAYLAAMSPSPGNKDSQNRRMAKSVADRLSVSLTPFVDLTPVTLETVSNEPGSPIAAAVGEESAPAAPLGTEEASKLRWWWWWFCCVRKT